VSLKSKEVYGWMVSCDLCESVGALCERDWREMSRDEHGQPIHLCRDCRKTAVWCDTHHHFHRPADNHRRACASCGGLFTSQVSQRHDLCPTCRRSAPERNQPSLPYSFWSLIPNLVLQRLHLR
jgi:hypothetical protein